MSDTQAVVVLFFFKDPATPGIYALPLPDALPICDELRACSTPATPGLRIVTAEVPWTSQ